MVVSLCFCYFHGWFRWYQVEVTFNGGNCLTDVLVITHRNLLQMATTSTRSGKEHRCGASKHSSLHPTIHWWCCLVFLSSLLVNFSVNCVFLWRKNIELTYNLSPPPSQGLRMLLAWFERLIWQKRKCWIGRGPPSGVSFGWWFAVNKNHRSL